MPNKELLEKQNAIYVMTTDRLWEHLNPDQREDLEWIWEEMDSELDKLQNKNAENVLGEIFNKWGEDHNKNN